MSKSKCIYEYEARFSNATGINDYLHKIRSLEAINLMDRVRVKFDDSTTRLGQVVGKTSDNNYLTVLLDETKHIDCTTK